MRRASISQERVNLHSTGKLLQRMVVWAHEVQLAQGFPYAPHELQRLQIGQLRFIARMCPSWVHREIRDMSRDELIRWIQGDQPQEPIAPWSAPVRADYIPVLDEIRPPLR